MTVGFLNNTILVLNVIVFSQNLNASIPKRSYLLSIVIAMYRYDCICPKIYCSYRK